MNKEQIRLVDEKTSKLKFDPDFEGDVKSYKTGYWDGYMKCLTEKGKEEAEREAVAFAEWCANFWDYCQPYWIDQQQGVKDINNPQKPTTAELYKLWQESKSTPEPVSPVRTPALNNVYKSTFFPSMKHCLYNQDKLNTVLNNIEVWEFVCENPHQDGDFSYMCGSEYCRCSK